VQKQGTMTPLWRLALFSLLIALVASQTPAQNVAKPSVSEDGIAITPLVSRQTERASPCGLRLFSFEPRAATSQFYLEIRFTSQSNVKFEVQLSSQGHGAASSDRCESLSHTCNTTVANQRCTLVESCHPAALWFISVRTRDLVEGFFSLDAFTYALPAGKPLPINQDENVQEWTSVTSKGKVLSADPVNKFDFFTFTINPANSTPGTVLHLEVIPTSPIKSKLQTYLNYGTELAFPDYGCHSYREGTLIIPACEYAQGGQWSFTVVRTVNEQEYRVRLWKEEPVIIQLDNLPAAKYYYKLKRTEDEVYFKFDGLTGFDNNAAVRFFGIIDNVVGGQAALSLQYEALPWLECSVFQSKQCQTTEGCHVPLTPCELRNKTSGSWYLGVRALRVDQQDEPLTFTISTFVQQIVTYYANANDDLVGELLQGQQAHFLMKVPTAPSGNWLNLNLYVDRKNSERPAVIYIGPTPYPGPNEAGCSSFTKSCTASQLSDGDIKTCSLQLDPCELSAYPDGVYVSVIATADSVGGIYNNFWYQDTMGFTVTSLLWNPNEFPQALTAGRVVTGAVADNEYNIYRLVDFTGVLKLSVSGNLHNIFNPTPAQRLQSEVSVSIVYGPRVEGPSCGRCWNRQQTKVVAATETANWVIPTCQAGSEGVFVVVKGIASPNGPTRDFRHNEFVLSTTILSESFSGPNTRVISEGVHSSTFSTTGVFGGTEYWVLNFERRSLTNKALTLRLRAHPRSGRRMQLSSFNGDFDYSCGAGLPLDDSCDVNDQNKGFCTLTYQACFFQGDKDQRTFLVIITADTTTSILTNSSNDKLYDFSFDVVEQTPEYFNLNVPYPVEIIHNVYTHLTMWVPAESVGRDTLVIEAYFDAGHQTSRARQLTLYGNSPAHGDKLAGLPSHGCYCNSFAVTDYEKVVYIIDRCSLQAGLYHLSLFTDALQYLELSSRATIKAYTMPYIVPLAYEFPVDHRLYFGQSAVFQIEIDERMVNSLNRTDKELTIWTTVNRNRMNGTIQFALHRLIPDCNCNILGDVGIPCKFKDGNNGQCRLQRDYCQLRPPGHYYVRASVLPQTGFDRRQAVPFTLYASKQNLHPVIQPLQVVDGCGTPNRLPFQISTFVDSTELQFFRFDGPLVGQGERILSIYLANVTDGDVQVNIGNNFLPTTYCNAAQQICTHAPNGPTCIARAVCASAATHVSIKATSTNSNEPVKFKISACLAALDTLMFNAPSPSNVLLAPGASTSFQFDMSTINAERTPAIVAKVTAAAFSNGDRFTLSFNRGSCGTCRAFSKAVTCTQRDCSLVMFFCDLPSDFAAANWTFQLDNGRNATNQNTSYSVRIYSVDVPNAENIVTGVGFTKSVPSLSWVRFSWKLTNDDVLNPLAGIQSSWIEIKSVDARGVNVRSFIVPTDQVVQTKCPTRLATSHPQGRVIRYSISDCCTQPGTYQVLMFNFDFATQAGFQVTPFLQTLSQTTPLTWNFVSNDARNDLITVEPSSSVPGAISEALVQFPGSPIEPYSTLMVQIKHINYQASKDVRKFIAYIRQDGVAGPNGCFSFDEKPTFTAGEAISQTFACAAIRPHDLYIGVANGNDVPEQFAVYVKTIPAIKLDLDKYSNTIEGYKGVNQQFFVDLTRFSTNQNLKVEIQVSSGSAMVFYAARRPAGLNFGNVSCTGTMAPDAAGAQVNQGDTFTRTIPSCSVGANRFYVGVQPRQTGGTTFRVRVSLEAQLVGDLQTITWNKEIPNQGQQTGQNKYRGLVPKGVSGNTTYIRFVMDTFTAGTGVPSDYRIDLYREGSCTTSANSFCTRALGFKKCSTIVPACELHENTLYYFTIVQTAGDPSVRYTVRPELLDLTPTYLNAPDPETTVEYPHAINSHDIRLFIFTLPLRSALPGEKVTMTLASETCGDVRVSGNRGAAAGPGCAGAIPCTVAGCKVAELEMCNLFYRGDNHRTDFWVFVRGASQTQEAPIQYSLKAVRAGGYRMRTFNSLEVHTVYARSKITSVLSDCAAGAPPGLPRPCCNMGGAAVTSLSWKPDPTIYVYPIEGAMLLGTNQFFRLTIDSRYALNARFQIWDSMPSFCAQGPRLARPPIGLYQTCYANATNDHTCTININQGLCRLDESHQLFLTVDQVQLSAGLPKLDPTAVAIASVRHTAPPNHIIAVPFAETSQYFRYTLTDGEALYFKIYHDDNSTTWDRYHFRATILDVKGGKISIWKHWSCGTGLVCTDTECQDPVVGGECSKLLPDCRCSIDKVACNPGDFNAKLESFFRIQAHDLIAPNQIVIGRIQFDFIDPARLLANVTCTSVNCGEAIYFDGHSAEPTAEQLYRFQLTGVAGTSQLAINDNYISPYVAVGAQPACSRKRICSVAGSLGSCQILYRGETESVPYATVAPYQAENCADGTRKRFHLRADLYNPPIQELKNGVEHDSDFLRLNVETGCLEPLNSEYYKYVAKSGAYLYVEITTPGPRRQVWMSRGHISHHNFGERSRYTCTTATGQTTCYFVVACEYSAGTYYFQVSPGDHTITVTERDFIIKPLTIGQSFDLALPTDHTQLVAFLVGPIAGSSANPLNNLNLFYSAGVELDSWMTRHSLGDPTCALSKQTRQMDGTHVARECDVGFSDDTWVLHFVRPPTTICVGSSIRVRARWAQNDVVVVDPAPTHEIGVGKTVTIRHNVAGLEEDHVVYSRIIADNDAVLNVRLYKGNHKSTSIDYVPPCYGDNTHCSSSNILASSQYNQVAWTDACWHCGQQLFSTVFTMVSVTTPDQNKDTTTFVDQLKVLKWTPLQSDKPVVAAFAEEDREMHFYTAEITREEAARIDIEVVAGPGVEVAMYFTNCTIRAQSRPVVMMCFPGHVCHLPLQKMHNFGEFWGTSVYSDPFTDTRIRIVVSGFTTNYVIRYTSGIDTCNPVTKTNAPWCASLGYEDVLMSGHTSTFPNKDARAIAFYQNLTRSFACPLGNDCACSPLSETCVKYIKDLACLSAFGPCDGTDGNGFRSPPPYRLCNTIEFHCGKTFLEAALPEYSCGHNYYVSGVGWEDANGAPIFPIDTVIEGANDGSLGVGWAVLIAILLIAALIIAAAIAFVLLKRNNRQNYNLLSQEDFEGKGYAMM